MKEIIKMMTLNVRAINVKHKKKLTPKSHSLKSPMGLGFSSVYRHLEYLEENPGPIIFYAGENAIERG
jgi:hypothetical protein